MVKLYTGKGDDGTTGLYFGGRVRKSDPRPDAYGDVDEAQAAIGLARAEGRLHPDRGPELDSVLTAVEADLWVLMAELATDPDNRHKLAAGQSLVTADMVGALEERTDEIGSRFELPAQFVVPGENRMSALLDVARTVVRRAERRAVAVDIEGSQVVPYLNRLSSLLWTLARWVEEDHLEARAVRPDPEEP